MIYLCLYLPYWLNIHEDKWDNYCPNVIPIITLCAIIGMISLIISIWDVYGWYTIPLVLIIKWGFVMTAHFAPGGSLGSLIFIILVLSALVSGFFIEHNGYFN